MATKLLSPEQEAQRSTTNQAALLKVMIAMPVKDAIGVSCSFLLYCVYKYPTILRSVLNNPVNREGHVGMSLIKLLTRAVR